MNTLKTVDHRLRRRRVPFDPARTSSIDYQFARWEAMQARRRIRVVAFQLSLVVALAALVVVPLLASPSGLIVHPPSNLGSALKAVVGLAGIELA